MHAVIDQRRYLIPFRSGLLPQIFTGTLVIGGGVAGARAALAAAASGEVIVLCKDEAEVSNTAWAQGGIASVLDAHDSFEAHERDTFDVGCGLCDADVVAAVVTGGPDQMRRLADMGMPFDRTNTGEIELAREGGHHQSRVLHAQGDATGFHLQHTLSEGLRRNRNIRTFEQCFALDLISPSDEPGSPVVGAVTWHPKYGLQMIWAKTTILASGGAGQVYRETTNPRVATADGVAMAYRVGATIADMSFVQFHPTVLYLPGAPRSLISEAVRGEGAHLLDESGIRFMVDEHELAELAPRDIVSRAIVRRIAMTGGTRVWLDAQHIDDFPARFPSITEELSKYGIDPTKERIPVHPAAHYAVGGVRTDRFGRTDIPGLLAVGEVSCSGLHGANRLASNSLLEGLVIGEAAGRIAGQTAAESASQGPIAIVSDIRPSEHGVLDIDDVRSSLRSAMWRNVGIERAGPMLTDAVEMLDFWSRYTLDKIFDSPDGWEVQNMLTVGQLIARSALWRAESRGCHFRSDAPEQDDAYRVHDCFKRGRAEPVREEVVMPSESSP
ncbi:MAG TPA: L-aspartate oxidase [Phycisphaerales bacterium]|nr:L-aspartate oxidase [Phycisphaerales bacterium]